MRQILLIAVLLFLASCSDYKRKSDEQPVARVFDRYLYTDAIKDIMPANISSSDSVIIARDFIEKWIKKQLLLNKAELNLTEEEKNVDKQIDNYKTSLLIYKYEQSLIKQKLDTFVSFNEIKEYYNENSSNFLLNDNLV